ncbi:NAD(P)/FAD-dependent oxidoreductase [Carboxydothermus ferrireducens]|uniref:NAD(P)H-nitrite reductase large subunit n=1 Tax=Carboxydothermus ferrireducens DSM 11255 TaxID=1119529 RepID=A0ABX2R9Q5_9THEO|nr:FAD-dependent oxidoreductase [Carboxydothermus ferrireducens]NYE56605.1 NAD(P)H-nitrite reductase large subunit [Carboxydothermus ferrireducens DSM 11255]
MKYLIIGNSAAGIFAAESLRKLDPAGEITVLTDEPYEVYGRCLTSYFIAGDIVEEQIFIRPKDFYEKNRINLKKGEKVVRIDFNEKKVITFENSYQYDRLLIASGARAKKLSLPGSNLPGVFTLRTLDDAKNILDYSRKAEQAVIVGGGLVSLKGAYGLLKRGVKVTVVVASRQILSQVLDYEAAGLVQQNLEKQGMKFLLGEDVLEFLGEDKIFEVKLTNGQVIKADLVLIGKGVTPNVDFLPEPEKFLEGIPVDQYLRTPWEGVWAAGDVAKTFDVAHGKYRVNALWPIAAEQGRVAAMNMVGQNYVYQGSIGMNSLEFFGYNTIAAGITRQEEGYTVIKRRQGANYLKLVLEGEKLKGYILSGEVRGAGRLTQLIRSGSKIKQFPSFLKIF